MHSGYYALVLPAITDLVSLSFTQCSAESMVFLLLKFCQGEVIVTSTQSSSNWVL